MDGSRRFNPPPNWPAPPEGWTPPEGWQPDPAWGPAPEGWQLWTTAPAAVTEQLPAYGIVAPPAAAAPAPPPAEPAGRKKKRGKLGPALIAAGAVVVIATAAAALANGGNDPKKPAGNSAAAGTSSSSPSSSSTSSSSSSSSTSSTPPPPPKPTVFRYHGHGSHVIRISKPEDGDNPALISFTHTGHENFIVDQLDASLHETGNLVNEIGRWKGTVLLDADSSEEPTKRLKIQADGNWTVVIRLVSQATPMGQTARGSGTNVLLYSGSAGVATFTHTGHENFIVDFINGDGDENLVNEIGHYSGDTTISDGPGLLVITADGKWTVRIS